MKVVFAVPALTGTLNVECALSLMQAQRILDLKGIPHELFTLSRATCISMARNSLAAMFMADPEASDLFFIDSDLGFDSISVLKLLERPEHIVAGIYPMKRDEGGFPVKIKTKEGVPVGQGGLIEAELLPGGFMRIKREVFNYLAQAHPELKYDDNVLEVDTGVAKQAYDFFGMGVYSKQFRSEDYAFCQRWRDLGGQLWVYPDIDFQHVGSKSYCANYHQYLLQLPGGRNSELNLEKARAIDGWMEVPELVWLAQQAKFHQCIVELGCCFGRSTRALADNTTGKVYAVDDWYGTREANWEPEVRKGIFGLFTENLADHIAAGKVVPVTADHGDETKLPNVDADMVFVDGNHDYESVKRDLRIWIGRIQEGGILCGHDWNWETVEKAVKEILPEATVVPGTSIWFQVITEKEKSDHARTLRGELDGHSAKTTEVALMDGELSNPSPSFK